MSVVDPPSPISASLIERVKNILLKPKTEWDVIDAEAASIKSLYLGYALILAAIPAVCSLIGSLAFGHTVGLAGFGVTYRPSLGGAISSAVLTYVASLASVAIMGLVIEFLAGQFGGQTNRVQAFKVATYSMTASWVAGVFNLLPALGILAILGSLYGLYLLYLGLPKLMKTAQEKALPYTALVIVAAIVVNLILGAVVGSVMGATRIMTGGLADRGSVSGTVSVPGYGSVDVGKAEAAGKEAERAINAALGREGGGAAVTPIADTALQALLPASVSGFARGEVETVTGGMGDIQTTEARATYTRGDASIRLKVTDLGGAAAFAQLGSAFKLNRTERSGDRYERVTTENGRMVMEKYDGASRSGEYTVVVGQRFMVEANGDGVDMKTLKSAAASVNYGRLEALAR